MTLVIIGLLFYLAGIAGEIMFGVEALFAIFTAGGSVGVPDPSYGVALAGLIMMIVGTVIGKVLVTIGNDNK